MTISSTLSRWEYSGDGSTTVFAYTNKIFADTELEVYSDNVLQTLTTDYTVSGAGVETGGNVTYVTAPASGVKVVIIRVVADTQAQDYPQGGSLPSGVIENDIDRRTIVSQQQEEKLSRAMLTPAGEAQLDMTLPTVALRANKALHMDSAGKPSLVTPTDASGTVVTATGSTTGRSLAERFSEIFNVKDYGATGNGATDDSAAIQAALTAANSATYGGVVFFPPGRYLVTVTLLVGDLTSVIGSGMGSTVIVQNASERLFDALDATVREYVMMRDFTMEGQWNGNQTQGDATDRHLNLDNYNRIHLERIESLFCRQMALTGTALESLTINECRIWYCARDAINFSGSGGPVKITNNEIRHCFDDAIALHITNADGNPPREGTIITGNQMEDTFGIKVLGALKTIITNNVGRRMKSYAVQLGVDGTEGQNDNMDIVVSDNIFTDTFNGTLSGAGSLQVAIIIDSMDQSVGASETAVPPGQFDAVANAFVLPEPHWYNSNAASASQPHSGGWRIQVLNNIISQTLDDATNYSDYGYGAPESLNRLFTATGWTDPAVTSFMRSGDGIRLDNGATQHIRIAGNIFYGLNRGVRMQSNTRLWGIWFENNKFHRIATHGISYDETAHSDNANIVVRHNDFDLDPFLEHTNRGVAGVWSVDGSELPACMDVVNLSGVILEGNTLRNCYTLVHDDASSEFSSRGNWYIGDFTGTAATNKGIRDITEPAAQYFIFEDSDETSANYGDLITMPEFSRTSIPTTGSYFEGHFVRNESLTINGSNMVLAGWLKLTTDALHVSGTNWAPVYWSAVTPAT